MSSKRRYRRYATGVEGRRWVFGKDSANSGVSFIGSMTLRDAIRFARQELPTGENTVRVIYELVPVAILPTGENKVVYEPVVKSVN